MPAKNPRLNITLDKEYAAIIAALAKKQGRSLSATAKALLIEAIDMEEDRYLSALADERIESSNGKYYSHEDAWK